MSAVGCDPAQLFGVLVSLSRMAIDHPEIEEVDVNPLFANRDGVMAADALVVLSARPGDGRAAR